MKAKVFAFQGSINLKKKKSWRSPSAILLQWSWMDNWRQHIIFKGIHRIKAKISSYVYGEELNIWLPIHQNVKSGINRDRLFSFSPPQCYAKWASPARTEMGHISLQKADDCFPNFRWMVLGLLISAISGNSTLHFNIDQQKSVDLFNHISKFNATFTLL